MNCLQPETLVLIGAGVAAISGYAGFTLARELDREKAARAQRLAAYSQFLTAHGQLGTSVQGSQEWLDAFEFVKRAEQALEEFGEPKVVKDLLGKFGRSSGVER